MNRLAIVAILAIVTTAGLHRAVADTPCGPAATRCTPRWEDKKTKKPTYSQKCDPACVRGVDQWCDHGRCPEATPPCGIVIMKHKLLKREEEKVDRVLKYDVGTAACAPCPLPPPDDCGPCWYDLPGHVRRLFGAR